jgi:hypothetical protein
MLLFQIYVAFAFFRCQRTAPKLVIALLIARVVFNLIDWLAVVMDPVVSVAGENPGLRDLFGSVIVAGVWIPYFLRSKRVKATFKRPETETDQKPLCCPTCRLILIAGTCRGCGWRPERMKKPTMLRRLKHSKARFLNKDLPSDFLIFCWTIGAIGCLFIFPFCLNILSQLILVWTTHIPGHY